MPVRRLGPGDEPVLREVRLRALADAPHAFDSTLEREQDRDLASWRRWFSGGATFILETPEGPAGLAAGIPHRDEPETVLLVSMWVDPKQRGTGGGDRLVEAILAWARAEAAEEVCLHVLKGSARARRFYERNGFRATGTEILRDRDGAPEIEMRRAP